MNKLFTAWPKPTRQELYEERLREDHEDGICEGPPKCRWCNEYPLICDHCNKDGKIWLCSACLGWYHEECFTNHRCWNDDDATGKANSKGG